MSAVSASGTVLRRTILNARLAPCPSAAESSFRGIRPAAFRTYRSVHSARIPAITASEARHRPALRANHQPARVGLSPTTTRTIFIQTEVTPNEDVSPGSCGVHD